MVQTGVFEKHAAQPNNGGRSDSTPERHGPVQTPKTCIERLLKAGADPQARNNAGQTPLAFAERFDNSQAATQLRNR
jgi:ankyrin repeat protein